ncbi:MAG: hypothetical protein LKG31_03975 [Lactobacillus sp.]|nr:hypothetical protein [Lactobacillus sp.]MCI1482093.1 hypothetical protein [Lactobacillus sp.]
MANDHGDNDASNGKDFLQGTTMYLFPTDKQNNPSYSNAYNGWLIGPDISDEQLSHYYLITRSDSGSSYSLVFDNPRLAQSLTLVSNLV